MKNNENLVLVNIDYNSFNKEDILRNYNSLWLNVLYNALMDLTPSTTKPIEPLRNIIDIDSRLCSLLYGITINMDSIEFNLDVLTDIICCRIRDEENIILEKQLSHEEYEAAIESSKKIEILQLILSHCCSEKQLKEFVINNIKSNRSRLFKT